MSCAPPSEHPKNFSVRYMGQIIQGLAVCPSNVLVGLSEEMSHIKGLNSRLPGGQGKISMGRVLTEGSCRHGMQGHRRCHTGTEAGRC